MTKGFKLEPCIFKNVSESRGQWFTRLYYWNGASSKIIYAHCKFIDLKTSSECLMWLSLPKFPKVISL